MTTKLISQNITTMMSFFPSRCAARMTLWQTRVTLPINIYMDIRLNAYADINNDRHGHIRQCVCVSKCTHKKTFALTRLHILTSVHKTNTSLKRDVYIHKFIHLIISVLFACNRWICVLSP